MAYMSKRRTTSQGDVPIASNLQGLCSSGSSATTKVVSMPDFDVLTEGVTIHVFFQNGNEADNPLLQVGSTAARPILYNGSQRGLWASGGMVSFTYYNSQWVQNDVHGGSGGGDLTYVYTQQTPSDTWTITHNLNKYPSVTVVDSSGDEVVGDCRYIDANSLRVAFSGAFSGAAYLN